MMEFSSQEANVIYNVRGDLRIEHTSETGLTPYFLDSFN